MKKLSSSRSSLLLMELILAILFFALASAICLQLFVKASLLSRDTQELDQAVRCASSAAELLSQADDPMEQIMAQFPESFVRSGENQVTLLFDGDFQSCESADMVYQMDILTDWKDTQTTDWSIAVYKDQHSTLVYELEGTIYRHYLPEVSL